MGLKQMIDKAMKGDEAAIAALPPIKISGDAHKVYSDLIRKWSGWSDATLMWGDPMPTSPFAKTNHLTHQFVANPERLLLNPNRVLLMVNPFRLRQEAVLTGALLHEAGHARHSKWMPRTELQAAEFKHSDGTDVAAPVIALARVMEEARIEGIIAAEADKIEATGFEWTLRACAAHLMPPTQLSADPAQAIVDLISSWALRAGRQFALNHHTAHPVPHWANDFTALLYNSLRDHIEATSDDSGAPLMGAATAIVVRDLLLEMLWGEDKGSSSGPFKPEPGEMSDTGPWMVDKARAILTILFPETPPEEMPSAGGGCGAGQSEEPAGQGVTDMPGEADEAGASEPSEGEAEESPTEEGSGAGTDTSSAMAEALAAMEGEAESQVESQSESDKSESEAKSRGAGAGAGASIGGGWRNPTVSERLVKTGAEQFLRELIEPNAASKVRVTDQPSSMIDGAALAAWKAGGQVKAPRFFQQVKRTVKPTPPVKIAVLVDVSSSMDSLQKPSALLSWALASACLDLRNFAGGGVQIESTLIHWGDSAKVIQHNGEMLPGIREVLCNDGTTSMWKALDLVEQQIPGFFEVKDQPENKLLVQFTDWKLSSVGKDQTVDRVSKALGAGVNMLSVVPRNWTRRGAAGVLDTILAQTPVQRGRNSLMHYDPAKPEAVWTQAAKALA